MSFDFGADTFRVYAQNVTDSGPLLNLGTYGIAGPPLSVANIQTNGGLLVSSLSGTTIYDDFLVVPEPSTVALGGLGALLIARRLRKNA